MAPAVALLSAPPFYGVGDLAGTVGPIGLPSLHITTADPQDGHELITPQAIAEGEGEPRYRLLEPTRAFALEQLVD